MKYTIGMKFCNPQKKKTRYQTSWTIIKFHGSGTRIQFNVERHSKPDSSWSCSVKDLDEYLKEGTLVLENYASVTLPEDLFEI